LATNFVEHPAVTLQSESGYFLAQHSPSGAAALSRKVVWTTLLASATIVIAPYLLRGYTVGHDTGFHMSWWLEMAGLFRQGVLHARWAPLAYYGYGEAAFLFYPPLSLYIGGLLTVLLGVHAALGVYVWLVSLFSGLSCFYLCRHFFGPRTALIGAVVYVLNPYQLLQIHARCSLAELLVSVWLPLFLLAICRLEEPGSRRIAVVALCFAAIALSNAPLTVVSGYSALAFALALAWAQKSLRLLTRFALAMALGVGLAAFFLLPAWFEKPWVVASVHAVVPPFTQLVPLSRLPNSHWTWALATVEVGQIILGFAACLLARRMRQRGIFLAFAALFAMSVLMVLPFSAALWRIAPALVYVQFPWRFLGPMGLALSFFVAVTVEQYRRGFAFAAGMCALGLVTLAAFTVMINLKANVLLASLENSISAGRGYLAWPFVLPRDVKIDQFGIPYYLKPGEPAVVEVGSDEASGASPSQEIAATSSDASRIAITHWSPELRDLTIDAPQPAWIRVRLFWYPGWAASVNGQAINHVKTNSRGALLLPLPAGQSHVQLVYRGTRDQTVGIILSLVSLIILIQMLRSGSAGLGKPA
jgi:6-pyruvoyl-tetrahydropterin synthase related domain